MPSAIEQIQQAIDAGQEPDFTVIPADKLQAAQDYAEMYRLEQAQTNPNLETLTESGAKSRNELKRAEESMLDWQYLQNELGGLGVRRAPEMGYTASQIINAQEKDADISRLLTEKVVPEGATASRIKTRSGEPIWGYIKPGEDVFYQLTPNTITESIPADVGAVMAHPMELAGGVAATALPGGALLKIAGAYGGAGFGRAADELRENIFQGAQDTPKEIAWESTKAGAWNALSERLGMVADKFFTGSKSFLQKTELEEIKALSERVYNLGGQKGSMYEPSLAEHPNASPLIKRIENIWNTISKSGERNRQNALESMTYALDAELRRTASAGGVPLRADNTIDWEAVAANVDDERLFQIIATMEEGLIAGAQRRFQDLGRDVTQDAMDRSLQYRDAVTQYRDASTAQINTLYDEAFQLADAQELAGERPIEFVLKGLKPALKDIDSWELVDAKTNQIKTVGSTDLNASLKGMISTLRGLAENQSRYTVTTKMPGMPGVTYERTIKEQRYRRASDTLEELKKLRHGLGRMSQPNADGTYSDSAQVAKKLYGVLAEAMKNPVHGTQAFKDKWLQANAAYQKQQMVMDFLSAGELMQDARIGSAETVTGRLYNTIEQHQPIALATVDQLKKTIKPEQFKLIQDGYIEHLLEDPLRLANRTWSRAELSLLPADARQLLKSHGLELKRLNSNEFSKALTNTVEKGERIKYLIATTKPGRVKKTLDAMNIPEQAYQATIFADLLSKVTKMENGKLVVVPSAVESQTKRYLQPNNAETFYLLSPEQRVALTDIRKLNSFISGTETLANSLVGATIQAKQSSFNVAKNVSGQLAYMRYAILGKLFTWKPSKFVLDRMLNEHDPIKKLRATVILSSQITKSLMQGTTNAKMPEQQTQ